MQKVTDAIVLSMWSNTNPIHIPKHIDSYMITAFCLLLETENLQWYIICSLNQIHQFKVEIL